MGLDWISAMLITLVICNLAKGSEVVQGENFIFLIAALIIQLLNSLITDYKKQKIINDIKDLKNEVHNLENKRKL